MTDARSADRGDYFRGQAASALLGAGLMLYFGFVRMLEPSGAELFDRAAWVFFHTLRIGGVVMLLVAAALLTCHSMALYFDAVVAGPIGLLLIGTGLAMAVGGGDILQVVINLVCGYGFITSAAHNYRAAAAHHLLPRGDKGGFSSNASDSIATKSMEGVASNTSPASLIHEGPESPATKTPLRTSNFELRTSPRESATGSLPASARPEAEGTDHSVPHPPLRTSNFELQTSSDPPPSGYLAALADKKRKDREDRSA